MYRGLSGSRLSIYSVFQVVFCERAENNSPSRCRAFHLNYPVLTISSFILFSTSYWDTTSFSSRPHVFQFDVYFRRCWCGGSLFDKYTQTVCNVVQNQTIFTVRSPRWYMFIMVMFKIMCSTYRTSKKTRNVSFASCLLKKRNDGTVLIPTFSQTDWAQERWERWGWPFIAYLFWLISSHPLTDELIVQSCHAQHHALSVNRRTKLFLEKNLSVISVNYFGALRLQHTVEKNQICISCVMPPSAVVATATPK